MADKQNEPNDDGPQYFGKYSAVVTDNKDPQEVGRIQVQSTVLPSVEVWAMPATPYAGNETDERSAGFFALPPIGARVWLEFEAGNLEYPIWTGCNWVEQSEFPPSTLSADDPSLIKMFQTKASSLIFNDQDSEGYIKLELGAPSVDEPVTMQFDKDGVTVTCGKCTLTMHPENGITLKVTDTTITMTDQSIALKAASITNETDQDYGVTVGTDLSISAQGKATVESQGDGSINSSGSLSLEAGASGSLKSGAGMDIDGGGPMNLKAPAININ